MDLGPGETAVVVIRDGRKHWRADVLVSATELRSAQAFNWERYAPEDAENTVVDRLLILERHCSPFPAVVRILVVGRAWQRGRKR